MWPGCTGMPQPTYQLLVPKRLCIRGREASTSMMLNTITAACIISLCVGAMFVCGAPIPHEEVLIDDLIDDEPRDGDTETPSSDAGGPVTEAPEEELRNANSAASVEQIWTRLQPNRNDSFSLPCGYFNAALAGVLHAGAARRHLCVLVYSIPMTPYIDSVRGWQSMQSPFRVQKDEGHSRGTSSDEMLLVSHWTHDWLQVFKRECKQNTSKTVSTSRGAWKKAVKNCICAKRAEQGSCTETCKHAHIP